jgi:hypothetical protein
MKSNQTWIDHLYLNYIYKIIGEIHVIFRGPIKETYAWMQVPTTPRASWQPGTCWTYLKFEARLQTILLVKAELLKLVCLFQWSRNSHYTPLKIISHCCCVLHCFHLNGPTVRCRLHTVREHAHSHVRDWVLTHDRTTHFKRVIHDCSKYKNRW